MWKGRRQGRWCRSTSPIQAVATILLALGSPLAVSDRRAELDLAAILASTDVALGPSHHQPAEVVHTNVRVEEAGGGAELAGEPTTVRASGSLAAAAARAASPAGWMSPSLLVLNGTMDLVGTSLSYGFGANKLGSGMQEARVSMAGELLPDDANNISAA